MNNPIFTGAGTDIIGLDAMNRQQQVWNLKQAMYAKAGVISSPSFLRIERTLDQQTSLIEFDLTDGNGSTARRVTEKRLKVGDTFTVMAMVMHLSVSAIQDGETESLPQDLMLQKLYTFPNPAAFGAGVAANLEALYNAQFRMTIDSTVFIEGINTRDFYRVGTAQQGYGVGGAGNAQYSADSWNYQQFGQSQVIPTIEINGGADVKPQIILGTSVDLANTADDLQNNIVLDFIGYINTGAASVQNDWLKALKDIAPGDIPALPIFKSIR